MKTAVIFFVASLVSAASPFLVFGQQEEVSGEEFVLSGTVLDSDGVGIANSNVIPLSEFGVPLNDHDHKPATMSSVQKAGGKPFVAFTRTNEQGHFSLRLPAGKYRIVAQSRLDRPHVEDLLAKNGSRLRIDGVVELQFDNEMKASEDFQIRPVGTGSVKLTTQEASDMLLVSTRSLAGDPALGFLALTGGFWGGLIAGTRMERKEIVISGLPDGEIQFYSFVNDNNGGMGGVRAHLIAGGYEEVYLPVIAGWSNGHRTPPAELEDLVQYFADHPDDLDNLKTQLNELQKRLCLQ